MKCSRHLSGTFPFLTARFPISLECAPHRLPVLRRRFHHHFLDLLLDEPLRQPLQLPRVASVPASVKLVCVVDFDVSHNYGQLLFMDINSGYPRIRDSSTKIFPFLIVVSSRPFTFRMANGNRNIALRREAKEDKTHVVLDSALRWGEELGPMWGSDVGFRAS